jgi:hypothetical protein
MRVDKLAGRSKQFLPRMKAPTMPVSRDQRRSNDSTTDESPSYLRSNTDGLEFFERGVLVFQEANSSIVRSHTIAKEPNGLER